MKFLFLILIIFHCQANTIHSVKSLIQAKTLSNLVAAFQADSHMATIGDLCRQRLAHKELPMECYQQLAIEKKRGLITQQQYLQKISILDEACRKTTAAGEIINLQMVQSMEFQDLSPRCKNELKNALCKFIYRENTVNPIQAFHRLWPSGLECWTKPGVSLSHSANLDNYNAGG